jgi:hypothetical protein
MMESKKRFPAIVGMKAMAVCLFVFCMMGLTAFSQPNRWQQRIAYKMNVQLDVNTNVMQGAQDIKYTNNSPDTLYRLFFHTYWNAFQPGSSMDTRSRKWVKYRWAATAMVRRAGIGMAGFRTASAT